MGDDQTTPEEPQTPTAPEGSDHEEASWRKLGELFENHADKAILKAESRWKASGNSSTPHSGSGSQTPATPAGPEKKKKSFLEKLITG